MSPGTTVNLHFLIHEMRMAVVSHSEKCAKQLHLAPKGHPVTGDTWTRCAHEPPGGSGVPVSPISEQTWGYTGAQPWATHTGIKGQGPRTRGAAQGRGGHQPHVTSEETELQTSGGSEEGFFSFASPSRYKEAQRVSTKDSSLEERPTRPGWLEP